MEPPRPVSRRLLGLAVGDALGTTLEFSPPGSSRRSPTWSAAGRSGSSRAQWTDDTSMALCLAESLVECDGFDPVDQMRALRALVAPGLS